MSEKFIIFSQDTVVQQALFETDKGGREFLDLAAVADMKPLPKVAQLTKEEAQTFVNHYGHTVACYPATAELLADMKKREWYLEYKTATEEDQPMQQPPATKKRQFKFKKGVFKGKHQPPIADSPKRANTPKEPEEATQKRRLSPLMLIACGCLLLALILVLVWNVQPFIQFTAKVAAKFSFGPFLQFLTSLWAIGGLFLAIAQWAIVIVGIVMYAICQAFELMPMLYTRDPRRIRSVLRQWSQWINYVIHPGDPRAVKELKRAHNRHPIAVYDWLCNARDVAYCYEFMVCTITHPICQPIWKIFWYVMTFQFQKIDWINLLLAVSVMFFVQIIVGGLLKVSPEIFPFEPVEARKLAEELKIRQKERRHAT